MSSEFCLDSECRIVSIDGVISDEVYFIKSKPDAKNYVTLEPAGGGSFKIHKERIFGKDDFGKAVVLVIGKEPRPICPRCKNPAKLNGELVDCICLDMGIEIRIANSVSIGTLDGEHTKGLTMTTEAVAAETSAIDIISQISHAGEVWVKTDVKFDHPNIDTKAFTILRSDPPRKMCFLTYNGFLSKKSNDIGRLKLPHFIDHTPDDAGKRVGYLLKGTVADEQARLQKGGYTKVS